MILLVFLDFQRRAVSGHPMTKSGTVASTAWKIITEGGHPVMRCQSSI